MISCINFQSRTFADTSNYAKSTLYEKWHDYRSITCVLGYGFIYIMHLDAMTTVSYNMSHRYHNLQYESLTHTWIIDSTTKLKAFYCYILCTTSTVKYFASVLWEQPCYQGYRQPLPGKFQILDLRSCFKSADFYNVIIIFTKMAEYSTTVSLPNTHSLCYYLMFYSLSYGIADPFIICKCVIVTFMTTNKLLNFVNFAEFYCHDQHTRVMS